MYHVRQQAYANVVYIRSLWSYQSHQTHLQWQNPKVLLGRVCSFAFGCSANKQQSPKQKPALVKPPMLVNTKELTLLTGGWDIRLQDRQSFGPQSTVWEPELYIWDMLPSFKWDRIDYWNDRQVCNLGTRNWFRPIKLQVTESSQWRAAVRH